jgi:hypothetical protein
LSRPTSAGGENRRCRSPRDDPKSKGDRQRCRPGQ